MSKIIPLTKGLSALVDDEDYEFLSQWKWCARISGNHCYAMRSEKDLNGRPRYIYMHRVVNQTPHGLLTDHVDGDGLNNTRANLRSATNAQNSRNVRRHKDSASPYKGVYRNQKLGKPWYAKIMIANRQVVLGFFDSEEDAMRAYETAAAQSFGEFHAPQRSNPA